MSNDETPAFTPIGDRRFRVLSLDGGGIQGAFTASLLAEIEEHTDVRITDYFDLIAGTSTGGIIALGLGLGFSAREVSEFYQEHGTDIFPEAHRRFTRLLRRVIKPAPLDPLADALDGVFGDRRLGEASVRLVVPSFNVVNGKVHLFKTAHHPRFRRDYNWRARNVALATSAAPTYFQAFVDGDGNRFVDGGVWANNPSAVALNEAAGVLGVQPDRIEVLSIGTTSAPFHLPGKLTNAGMARLVCGGELPDMLLTAQGVGALGMTKVMTGRGDRLLRVNETAAPDRFALDDPSDLEELRNLGALTARRVEPDIRTRFLDDPAPAFEPFHTIDAHEESSA